jgi:hypothetical protein
MSTRKHKLTGEEIRRAFAQGPGSQVPVILSPTQLGTLTGVPRKTVYEWLARGRFEGAYRKRGKRILLWRDRALDVLFNGKDWS